MKTGVSDSHPKKFKGVGLYPGKRNDDEFYNQQTKFSTSQLFCYFSFERGIPNACKMWEVGGSSSRCD